MLSPDTIAITNLRIKGDKRSSQKLARDIVQTSWAMPLPAHLQHAWIFVRQISVNGKLSVIKQQAARNLDLSLQRAVNVRNSNSHESNAIWFESFPVLLAFLLRDLALGHATRWYWEKWSYLLKYPRAEAITRLLCEHPEYIVSTLDELGKTKQLSLVINQISSQSAMTIARELMRHLQIPVINSNQKNAVDASTYTFVHEKLTTLIPRLTEWKKILAAKEAISTRQNLMQNGYCLLASICIGLHYTPLFLYRETPTFFYVLNELLTNQFESAALYKTQSTQNEGSVIAKVTAVEEYPSNHANKFDSAVTHENELNEFKDENSELLTVNTPMPFQHLPDNRQDVVDNKTHYDQSAPSRIADIKQVISTRQVYSSDANFNEDRILETSNIVLDSDTGGFQFITRSGGFFYLLNPINRLIIDGILEKQQSANVWSWLLEIYYLFAKQNPTESSDKNLALFLMQQLQPELSREQLTQKENELESQERSTFSKTLFKQLKKNYAHETFWKELHTVRGFLSTPAQIIATASHIDVYYSLQSIRLDLRLAAWDVNPGWLPWLGRVVKFHYLEELNLPLERTRMMR
jgi:hypothetical protein